MLGISANIAKITLIIKVHSDIAGSLDESTAALILPDISTLFCHKTSLDVDLASGVFFW